jgi:molybdenum-dependent DNA-binding transcriptional regulator ModE
MTDLNALVIFAKVVEAKSFSEAARRLGMPVSTVSRRVAELEDQLGVRLLDRSTRNLRLTDLGSEVLEYAQRSAEASEAHKPASSAASIRTATLPTFSPVSSISGLMPVSTNSSPGPGPPHAITCNAPPDLHRRCQAPGARGQKHRLLLNIGRFSPDLTRARRPNGVCINTVRCVFGILLANCIILSPTSGEADASFTIEGRRCEVVPSSVGQRKAPPKRGKLCTRRKTRHLGRRTCKLSHWTAKCLQTRIR